LKTAPYTIGEAKLSPRTRIGLVHLKVKHLKEQTAFYREVRKVKIMPFLETRKGLYSISEDLKI